MKQNIEEKENQKRSRKELASWIRTIVFSVVFVLVMKSKVVILAKVPTGSMLDTIQLEDRLIGNRLAYAKEDPKRGDIVIFYAPDEVNELYIKRVIGLPGEKVVIEDGKIYINDSEEPLQEDYLKQEPWVVENGPYEFEVPEDCYLMLGDNRNDSKDARYWNNKYVSKDKIVAKAMYIWFPFSDIGSLDQDIDY